MWGRQSFILIVCCQTILCVTNHSEEWSTDLHTGKNLAVSAPCCQRDHPRGGFCISAPASLLASLEHFLTGVTRYHSTHTTFWINPKSGGGVCPDFPHQSCSPQVTTRLSPFVALCEEGLYCPASLLRSYVGRSIL